MPNPQSETSGSTIRAASDQVAASFPPFGTRVACDDDGMCAAPVNTRNPNLVLHDSPSMHTGDVVIRDSETEGSTRPTSDLVIGRARVVSVRRKITLAEAVQLGERYMKEREAARDRANRRELERILG